MAQRQSVSYFNLPVGSSNPFQPDAPQGPRKLQKSPRRGRHVSQASQDSQASIEHAASVSTPGGLDQRPEILIKTISADPRLQSPAPTPTRRQSRPEQTVRRATSWMTRRFSTASQGEPKPQDPGSEATTAKSPTIAGPQYSDSKHEHKPRTGNAEECVYVLTLKTSEDIAGPMNEMREQWFPKHLNRTPAHLTLFHALPHSQLEAIESYLKLAGDYMRPFQVQTKGAFRMRRGVGINLGSGLQEAKLLHDGLRTSWIDFLSDQDAGGWKPHWTVMNKENDTKRVEEAYEKIGQALMGNERAGLALGMDLWKYNKGTWDWFKEFQFVGVESAQHTRKTMGQCHPDAVIRPKRPDRGNSSWKRMSFRGTAKAGNGA